MMKKAASLLLFLYLIVSAQAQKDSVSAKTDSLRPGSFRVVGKAVSGTAGMYSSKADGTKTASGAIFSNSELTGASNKFKLNSWVRVTNTKNKRSVIVKITDRTSKKETAPVIELSRAAVGVLNFLKTGNAKIKIEQIVFIDSLSNHNIVIDTSKKEIEPGVFVDTAMTPNTFIPTGKSITGIASFYSANLDGTKTATGERYRNSKFTAASNNFKLNTWVLVTNLKNQKSVIVRINDRMHPRMKRKGRVVDLSGVAATTIDLAEDGITKVKVDVIEFVRDNPPNPSTDSLPLKTDLVTVTDSIKSTSAKVDSANADPNTVFGIASFYSFNLDGTKTSTGEIYRNNKMSAASNNFDLNTWFRVTNLTNNRSVILRINDHMHPRMKEKGRVVDLSRIAAKKLNFIKNGLAQVKVELVDKGTLN